MLEIAMTNVYNMLQSSMINQAYFFSVDSYHYVRDGTMGLELELKKNSICNCRNF